MVIERNLGRREKYTFVKLVFIYPSVGERDEHNPF
jgi:hypothetical protein